MFGNVAMLAAAAVATAQTPAITPRRSQRSASAPMGYCVTTPEKILTAMKVARATVSRPLRRAYTGPIEKTMELITPANVTAATPSGEMRYSSRNGTVRGTVISGVNCDDSKVGTIATQMRPETSMNGADVAGPVRISRNCADPRPT